jgi:chromosomal replication initiator protein
MTIALIQRLTAQRYGVTVGQLLGRQRRYAPLRQEAMAVAVQDGRWSLTQIGRAFDRDHTTVLYAARKMGAR